MSSQESVLTRRHGADGRLVVNDATPAGTAKRGYGGLCRVRKNFLGHKLMLARIIRREPKAAVAIRPPIAIGQRHSTMAAQDVEAINHRFIA